MPPSCASCGRKARPDGVPSHGTFQHRVLCESRGLSRRGLAPVPGSASLGDVGAEAVGNGLAVVAEGHRRPPPGGARPRSCAAGRSTDRRQAPVPVRDLRGAAAPSRPGDGAETRAPVDPAVRLVRGKIQDDWGRPRGRRQGSQGPDRARPEGRSRRAADPDLSRRDEATRPVPRPTTAREPRRSISIRAYPACPWR